MDEIKIEKFEESALAECATDNAEDKLMDLQTANADLTMRLAKSKNEADMHLQWYLDEKKRADTLQATLKLMFNLIKEGEL